MQKEKETVLEAFKYKEKKRKEKNEKEEKNMYMKKGFLIMSLNMKLGPHCYVHIASIKTA